MPAHRSSLVRTITVGCALAGAIAVGAGSAGAAPEPAFTSHTFRTDFLVGAPFPVGYQVLDAATNGTGVVRLSTGLTCNSLTPDCRSVGEFRKDLSVRWVNFATGASGGAVATVTPSTITTGAGPVGIFVTAANTLSVPALGVVNP